MDATRLTDNGSQTRHVSVSIEAVPQGCNLHIGIVYRWRHRLRRVHFAFHRKLENIEYDNEDEIPCALPDLDIADELWLAKFFQRIAFNSSNRKGIPYNFRNDEAVEFDGTTGACRFGPDSTGLGCATFVVAAFRSGGVPLVDASNWPGATENDRLRRTRLIEFLRNKSPEPDAKGQADVIEKEIDAPCISPQHVVGACLESSDTWPVGHAICQANGAAIVEKLGVKGWPL
jgi:hypothetical protein